MGEEDFITSSEGKEIGQNAPAEDANWPAAPAGDGNASPSDSPERRTRSDRRMGDRRSADRRVQERRIQARRQGETSGGASGAPGGFIRGRALIVPYAAAAAVIGLVAGFGLARKLDFGSVRFKESAFGLDASRKIARGRPFDGLKEMRGWSESDRAAYRKALDDARAGRAAQAAAGLVDLRKAHPEYPLPHALAALALAEAAGREAGDPVAAQAAYRAALSADSAHPFGQYAAGRVCEALGLADSAEAHYARAVRASPQFAYPYVGLGRAHLRRGEARIASLNFRTAIGLMESDPEAYQDGPKTALPAAEHEPIDLLAALFYQNGAEDSARMALEYGEEHGVKTEQMALVQGWLWESRGFLGKADSLYRALQAKNPGNPAFRDALATLGWKPPSRGENRADAEAVFAISLLDPLAHQHPQNAPVWMALGQAYFRRGLYGMATEAFDSSLKYDPVMPGLAEKRDAAYQALLRQSVPAPGAPAAPKRPGLSPDEQVPVVIPGSIALLGTYSVPWGSTPTEVRQAYPKKDFRTLPSGNLLDAFEQDGIRHEYVLAFRQGKLWGVRAYMTDSAGVSSDLFGRMIGTKAKISGEGKGTGEAKCSGYRAFQGAIWENDDTFEFMAQFQGEEHRVRLARMGREYLPKDRRLCDLVVFLRDDTWK